MSQEALFTVDHQGFYLKSKSFYPLIQEESLPLSSWSNAVLIRLPADLDQDLDWSSAKALAEDSVAAGKFILWDLDLKLSSFVWKPDDLVSFHSFSLALDQFNSDIFPLFRDQTLGVSLYRGKLDFPHRFPLSWWEGHFMEWQEESRYKGPDPYSIFCATLLSDYLHRLVSILQVETIPFAFFDVIDYPLFSQVAHLLLQERFEYITLGLKGSKGPHPGICWEEGELSQGYLGKGEKKMQKIVPAMGLFLPQDSIWDSSVSEQIDRAFSYLNDSAIPFRTIEEGKLTEQWDGLDQILVASRSMVSSEAARRFQGFVAAGGHILYL